MRTVFGLFENYDDAKQGVGALLENDFEFEDLNAIASEDTVKNNMDVNYKRRSIAVTDEIDGHVRGLDHLVGGEQPTPVVHLGPVYAGGEEATLVARNAADQAGQERGLVEVLEDVEVPEEVGERYRAGIVNGGVLLWVRAADDRAPDAIDVMQTYNAKHVSHYGA